MKEENKHIVTPIHTVCVYTNCISRFFLKEININISRIPILVMAGINFKSETVIYNHVQLRYQLVDIVHPMCIKSVKFPQTFGI